MPPDFTKALKSLEGREEVLRQQARDISSELETIRIAKLALKQAAEAAPPPAPSARTVATLVLPVKDATRKPN